VVRPDARRLTICTGANDNAGIFVMVRDSGPGFPAGIVEQLFEPFFSTKAEGTGMGLAIARSIVEAHKGTLSAENCSEGGACFTIILPEAGEDLPVPPGSIPVEQDNETNGGKSLPIPAHV